MTAWDDEHPTDTSQPGREWCMCGGRGKYHHNPDHIACPEWCPKRKPSTVEDYIASTARAVGVDPTLIERTGRDRYVLGQYRVALMKEDQ